MSSMLPPVIVELKASIADFQAKMAEARGELDATAEEGEKSTGKLSGLGKGLVLGIGAAAVGVGALAVDMGEKFQTATASMAGHAGISMAAAKKMGNTFLNTAGSTTFSAQEMMGAIAPIAGEIENLTGHTLTTADSMRVLKGSMDLAEASGEPLAAVTKSLVDIMLPFHMNLSQSSNAANILWNSQRALGVTTADLSKTYERLVPRVAGSGMSLQQMSGFVVELSHSLGGGRQALRTAGTAIQGLISPSSTANKALASMGVQLFDSTGKFIGMGPAIQKMHAGLAKLPGASAGVAAAQQIVALTNQQATLKAEAQTKAVKAQEAAISGQLPALKQQAAAFTASSAMQAIFGRQANGMLAVIAGGAATFNKYTSTVGKSGDAQSAAAINAATMHGQMDKLKSTTDDLATKLGVVLVPAIAKLMGVLSSVTTFLMKNKAVALALGIVIGGVLLAATVAWGIALFTTGGALAFLMSPITLVVAGLLLLGLGIYELIKHFSAVMNWLKSQWSQVLAILTGPIGLAVLFIKDHFNTIKKDAGKLIDDIVQFFTTLPGRIMSALAGLGSMFLTLGENLVKSLLHAFTHIGGAIGDALKGAVSHIPVIGGALNAIGLAKGGYVTKPTLALVGEAGPEWVIPAAQAKAAHAAGISPLSSAMASSGGSSGMNVPSSTSTVYQIQSLMVVANNPEELQHALASRARLSSLSANPMGGTNLSVAS